MRKEYIFMWSTAPTMPSYWATAEALKERAEVYPTSRAMREIFQYCDGKTITAYMPKNQIEYYKRVAGKEHLNPAVFRKYRLKYQKEKHQWWKWIRGIEKKDYSRISITQLKREHRCFTRYMRDAIAYFGSTRTEFTYLAEQRLEKIIKYYFEDNWTQVFGVLTEAIELDDIQKEHIKRLKLLSSKITNRVLLTHVSNFPWLVFGQLSEKKATSFLRRTFRKEKDDYKKTLIELRLKKRTLKKQQEEIYKQLGKNEKEARYLAYFLQTQAIERMNIKSYWAGCFYLSRNMWSKISEVLNLSTKDILTFVAPPEIQQLLSGKYSDDMKKIISLRKKSFAIYFGGGKEMNYPAPRSGVSLRASSFGDEAAEIKILNHKEADNLFKDKIKKSVKKEKVIRGQPASLGIYKGKVRKVMPGDLDMLQQIIKVFREGEVLVTSMTQPNMMVIARRAGAIVTDEGGITSHAAIISRELKIPCIVGCLEAMKILENGDLVEVDANKGIIKILKK